MDHRTKVARLRKEKMRLHLMQSALELICVTKGHDNLLINDFIKHAKVSRGTFYNYFQSTYDLFSELIIELSDELLEVIEPLIKNYENPLSRIYIATTIYITTVQKYPIWANLITNAGSKSTIRGKTISYNLTRDLILAMEKNLIEIEDLRATRDIFLGSIHYSLETVLTEQTDDIYIQIVMQQILRILGLSKDAIFELRQIKIDYNFEIHSPLFSILNKHF